MSLTVTGQDFPGFILSSCVHFVACAFREIVPFIKHRVVKQSMSLRWLTPTQCAEALGRSPCRPLTASRQLPELPGLHKSSRRLNSGIIDPFVVYFSFH